MAEDLTGMPFEQIEALVSELGGKPYYAQYLFAAIHAKGVDDVAQVTPLPKAFRSALAERGYRIERLDVTELHTDPDGTAKLVFDVGDGRRIESVVLTDGDRRTLCLSCQVGCRMACRFCATGRLGFARSLGAGAIVEQVYQAAARCGKIHNVVYMGMGEPFDNTQAVLDSIRILNHPLGLGLGQRHITLSTCGLPEAIRRFAQLHWQVRLAISLHAPDDALRRRLMPVAGKVPLTELLDAVRDYQRITHRRVTFEYCLMRDVNDSPAQARATADLLHELNAAVNLIEFNPHPGCGYKPSDRDRMHRFRDVLGRAGVETVIRYRRGRSIKAACGQLGAAWLTDGANDGNPAPPGDQASCPS